MPQITRVLFDEYGTQLRLERDGSLVLNVLCGRIAQFGVEFPLNSDEIEGYKLRGDAFIQELSREVQNNYKPFAERGRER